MSDNLEARRLVADSIDRKEAELAKLEKDKLAAWRKHQRSGQAIKAVDAELEGLREALNKLGGPIPEETEPDEEAAE